MATGSSPNTGKVMSKESSEYVDFVGKSRDFTNIQLSNLAQQLGTEWKTLAIFLGFNHADIQHFVSNNHDYVQHAIFSMLDAWHKKVSGVEKSRRTQLIEALRSIGRTDLAEKLDSIREPGLMVERYKMTSMPRGICLIINNMEFTCEYLNIRTGSEIDEENVKSVFVELLGFSVTVKRNVTADEMIRLIWDTSRQNHAEYDCFVCFILSHGDKGNMFGSDGKPCNIQDLTSRFQSQNCPSLADKPKLFFMTACQHISSTSYAIDNIDVADFLFGYSAAPGMLTYRHQKTGTCYISELTKALRMYHNTDHIVDILTHVSNEMNKIDITIDGKSYSHMPATHDTLTKKLFFL